MNKQDLLTAITDFSSRGELSEDELRKAFADGKPKVTNSFAKEVGLSEVFYFIGGLIVAIGITVLIWQNWGSLNTFTKLFATLGFGVVSYIVGVLLNKEEKYGVIGYAFHLIAALIIPLGLAVTFYQAGFDTGRPGVQSLIAGTVMVLYFASYFVFKKHIFTLFSIIFASWFFFAITTFLVGSDPQFADFKFYEYRFLLIGLSYLFLGHYFASTEQKELAGPLYGFGSFFFLGAALGLGEWKPNQNILWELLFPLLVFAIFYLSVRLKAKPLLVFGTFYLMLYILKITGEYFSGTFGWPLSLMLCGIALIGIGYYAFTLNKKYLHTE